MDGQRVSEIVQSVRRTMAVLYGSETGNAEDMAVELGRTAERLHFQTTVDEMDGFKLVRWTPYPWDQINAALSLRV